eukprot:GILJ01007223.1.p1 GENE.GILJ01007223.1~~GILJ01007223.1.p1  ORF type:complete len:491 (+),score=42.51 GILJ01007223.1:94-1566(+)
MTSSPRHEAESKSITSVSSLVSSRYIVLLAWIIVLLATFTIHDTESDYPQWNGLRFRREVQPPYFDINHLRSHTVSMSNIKFGVLDIETEHLTCYNHTVSPNVWNYQILHVDVHGYSCTIRNIIYRNGKWILPTNSPLSPRLRTFTRAEEEGPRSILLNMEYDDNAAQTVTKVFNSSEVVVMFSRCAPHYYGHMIVDGSFSIMYMLHIHRHVTRNNTVLMMDHGARLPFDDLLYTTTANDVVYTMNTLCPPGETCLFPEVIVGSGGLGWYFDDRQFAERVAVASVYAPFAFANFNDRFPEWDSFGRNVSDKLRVFLIQRGNNRQVKNLESIHHTLSSSFSEIAEFSLHQMEYISVQQQVSMFKSASIVIGVDGTALDNVVWMRNGTCVILLSRSPAETDDEKFNHHWSAFQGKHFSYYAPYTSLWRTLGIGVQQVFTHIDPTHAPSREGKWSESNPLIVHYNEVGFAFEACLEHIQGYHYPLPRAQTVFH